MVTLPEAGSTPGLARGRGWGAVRGYTDTRMGQVHSRLVRVFSWSRGLGLIIALGYPVAGSPSRGGVVLKSGRHLAWSIFRAVTKIFLARSPS